MKTTPDGHVMTMLQRHQDEIVTAAPVWHELRYGCLRLPFRASGTRLKLTWKMLSGEIWSFSSMTSRRPDGMLKSEAHHRRSNAVFCRWSDCCYRQGERIEIGYAKHRQFRNV